MKPNVLCVGFAKCGTTTLYDILVQHPDIYLSGIKEPIFYESPKFYARGLKWYENRYYPKHCSKKVIMEINPVIGRDVSAKTVSSDFGKNIKIIFFIRNPIDRLYSNFKMNLVDGSCFNTLEEHIGNSTSDLFEKWLINNFSKGYIDHNTLKKSNLNKFFKNGNYYSIIKDFYEVFSSQNVRVFLFEDFIKDQTKTVNEILEFIGVAHCSNINYNIRSNKGNRIPKNKFTIKCNRFWYSTIWKNVVIQKFPFISTRFCKLLNKISWNIPLIFSVEDKNEGTITELSKKILSEYFYDMVYDLEKFLKVDLLKKWELN